MGTTKSEQSSRNSIHPCKTPSASLQNTNISTLLYTHTTYSTTPPQHLSLIFCSKSHANYVVCIYHSYSYIYGIVYFPYDMKSYILYFKSHWHDTFPVPNLTHIIIVCFPFPRLTRMTVYVFLSLDWLARRCLFPFSNSLSHNSVYFLITSLTFVTMYVFLSFVSLAWLLHVPLYHSHSHDIVCLCFSLPSHFRMILYVFQLLVLFACYCIFSYSLAHPNGSSSVYVCIDCTCTTITQLIPSNSPTGSFNDLDSKQE